jgi:Secretion system C-terminal sorting domain
MQKTFLAAATCLLSVHCFSQTDSNSIAFNNTTTDATVKTAKADAVVYPNPARNKVSLQVTGFDPGMVSIRIIDISGAVLKEESRLLITGDDEEIVLFFFLPAGIYFITMQEQDKWVRKKLIVQ